MDICYGSSGYRYRRQALAGSATLRGMPATVPSHQAAVVGFKLWRPHRFDGVALVIGSAVPDAAYALTGLGVDVRSHAWHALFWFDTPLTWLLAVLVRRAAPYVVAHLPNAGPLGLGDYGVLAAVRHPAAVTAYSAFLGALSHQLWDTVTHPYVLIGDPFLGPGTHLPGMHVVAFAGLPWWRVVQLASELVGVTVVAAAAIHIGRTGRLREWHGPAPTVSRRPRVFWPVAVVVGAVLAGIALALPRNDLVNVAGSRALIALTVALLAAAAAVRFSAGGATSPKLPPRTGPEAATSAKSGP